MIRPFEFPFNPVEDDPSALWSILVKVGWIPGLVFALEDSVPSTMHRRGNLPGSYQVPGPVNCIRTQHDGRCMPRKTEKYLGLLRLTARGRGKTKPELRLISKCGSSQFAVAHVDGAGFH